MFLEYCYDLINFSIDIISNFLTKFYIFEVIWWIYVIVFAILFLLSFFGTQLGLRKFYIKVMLTIFEFSSCKIQRKKVRLLSEISEDEAQISTPTERRNSSPNSLTSIKENCFFEMSDLLPFLTSGMTCIVQDSVTPSFVSEELPYYWNLLSRTNKAYGSLSFRVFSFWIFGFIVRYTLLLPLRLIIFVVGLSMFLFGTLFVGCLPSNYLKKKMNYKICTLSFDFLAGCLSLVATFHNPENKPKSGIAVANHTSVIDSLILAIDNYYDMVGQRHGGLLGLFMKILSRSSCHIWFDRYELKDRYKVVERLREHASDPTLPPILIFPEGVCVNNTSVMQFKKGTFEVADVIHPIAIKFDPRFGDAFWWQDYFIDYLLSIMTSWAIVVDVWYLPPMRRRAGESSVAFAERVKSVIASKGGLTDLSWDGFLKANPAKQEWLSINQRKFAGRFLTTPEA